MKGVTLILFSLAPAVILGCSSKQDKMSQQLILGSWKVVKYEEVHELSIPQISIDIELPGMPAKKDSTSDSNKESEHKPDEVYHFMDNGQLNFYMNDLRSKEKYSYKIKNEHLIHNSQFGETLKYRIEKLSSDSLIFLEPFEEFSAQHKIICVKIPNIFETRRINEDSRKLSIKEVSNVIFRAFKGKEFQLIDRINVNDNEEFRQLFKKSFLQTLKKGVEYGITWGNIELVDISLDDGIRFSENATELEKLIVSSKEPDGYFVDILISHDGRRFNIDCGYLDNTDWGWSFESEFKIAKNP